MANIISSNFTTKSTSISAPISIGQPGKSAYQIALANVFVGTETEWINNVTANALIPYQESICQLVK